MTAVEFFWSAGHIGWPLFSIIVFSIFWWGATDIVWRTVQLPFRRLLVYAGLVWIVGLTVLIACLVVL